jgi:hypothetical protein
MSPVDAALAAMVLFALLGSAEVARAWCERVLPAIRALVESPDRKERHKLLR